MAVFQLEVDVVVDRDIRPWKSLVYHVTLSVDDRRSWVRMENEARNFAAWMCWGVRGDMVAGVRIMSVEE